jgi:hypothetical protein
MRQTTSDILAVQEVSQVMLGNRTAGRNNVLRAVVRPTAPVNPSVKIAVKVSAYQFISSFLVILAIDIFDLPLVLWVYVVRRDAKSSLQRTVSGNELEIGC